jgi:hypothetical protein
MRNFLFVIAVLVIPAAGATFFASLVKHQSQWAYQVCTSAYGLCEHPWWIGVIAAAAAVVALGLRATEI